jgi:hypothetical protein
VEYALRQSELIAGIKKTPVIPPGFRTYYMVLLPTKCRSLAALGMTVLE